MSRMLEEGDEVAEGSVVIECWTRTGSVSLYEGSTLSVTRGFNVLAADCVRQKAKSEVGFITTNIYWELPKGESTEVPTTFGRYKISNFGNGVVVKTRCRWPITRRILGEALPEEVTLPAA